MRIAVDNGSNNNQQGLQTNAIAILDDRKSLAEVCIANAAHTVEF